MKNKTHLIYIILIPIVVIIIAANLFADLEVNANSTIRSRTEGSVDFQIRTTSYSGEYAPHHVLAIWVTDGNDQFVRTLVRRAWEELEDLVKWNNMTGGNYQNAIITGATVNNHTMHNINWDCTDRYLQAIPDGVYRIYVEFNEDDAPPNGPWTMVEFIKGTDPVTLTPTGGNYFHDIELIYTPVTLPDPTIEITSPANNSVIENIPFEVEFEVTNFDPVAGDGFIGYYLNGSLIQLYDNLNPFTIDDLAAGTSEIKLLLHDEFGNAIDPEISDAINVIYEPINVGNNLPQGEILLGNYPNPFNPSTIIYFNIEPNQNYELAIYNVKGEKIKTFKNYQTTQSAKQQVIWNGTDDFGKPVASGVYYYVLKFGKITESKKMLLLK